MVTKLDDAIIKFTIDTDEAEANIEQVEEKVNKADNARINREKRKERDEKKKEREKESDRQNEEKDKAVEKSKSKFSLIGRVGRVIGLAGATAVLTEASILAVADDIKKGGAVAEAVAEKAEDGARFIREKIALIETLLPAISETAQVASASVRLGSSELPAEGLQELAEKFHEFKFQTRLLTEQEKIREKVFTIKTTRAIGIGLFDSLRKAVGN